MDDLGEIRHQAAIAGRISDQQDGGAIAGAQITLTTTDPAISEWLALRALANGRGGENLAIKTVSGEDGRFCFLNLPNGTYTVTAEWAAQGTRYGTATASATVGRDANGAVKLATLDLALPPTRVTGKVLAKDAAVPMAEVRLKGGGESTFTDANGAYALSAIEPGERTLRVQAEGFAADERVSVARRGESVTENFSLA